MATKKNIPQKPEPKKRVLPEALKKINEVTKELHITKKKLAEKVTGIEDVPVETDLIDGIKDFFTKDKSEDETESEEKQVETTEEKQVETTIVKKPKDPTNESFGGILKDFGF